MLISSASKSFYLLLILSIFLCNCKPKNKTNSHQIKAEEKTIVDSSTIDVIKSYQEVAAQKLGENVLYKFNKTKEFVICYTSKKSTAFEPNNNLKFLIYRIETGEILHENMFYSGNIEWVKPYTVKVTLKPEMVKADEDPGKSGYYYDVKNNQQTPFK